MNPHNFQTALDNCIGRIRAGETVGQCLADYPEMAADLLPLLSISADLLELEPLAAAPAATASGRDAMFAAFDEVEQERNKGARWAALSGTQWSEWLESIFGGSVTPQLGLVGRLALLILGLTVSGGWVANASADSIPGDQLYSVKLLIEDARLSLTFDEPSRITLEAELNERRQKEIQQLQEQGRSADVAFSGRLEAINDDSWLIDGIEVQPIPELIVDEALSVGQTITLNGQVDEEGAITVDRVELPTVPVAPIEAEAPVQNTSTPTQTPTNVPPTATQPIVEPAATETPVPTQTDIPTAVATATPVPTDPIPTDTPMPTVTPSPTNGASSLNPTATPTEPVRDATATPTKVRDGINATREANQATRAAEATAQAEANQATKEAMATQNAINNQATKEALATQNAINNQATRDAIATQVVATRQAAATATAEAARATHQAGQQATRQANATAAAEATQNAQPTATPIPPSPTPTMPPVPTDTPTPQESDVPSPTPEPSDRPTATPERDG